MLFCSLHGYTGCFFYRLLSRYVQSDAVFPCDKSMVLGKVKVIPLQALCSPEDDRGTRRG